MTFGPKSLKLNSRPVYCSRLYGRSQVKCGHAFSLQNPQKRWHCNVKNWNEKIEKGLFRNPKSIRKSMKLKSADLEESSKIRWRGYGSLPALVMLQHRFFVAFVYKRFLIETKDSLFSKIELDC